MTPPQGIHSHCWMNAPYLDSRPRHANRRIDEGHDSFIERTTGVTGEATH